MKHVYVDPRCKELCKRVLGTRLSRHYKDVCQEALSTRIGLTDKNWIANWRRYITVSGGSSKKESVVLFCVWYAGGPGQLSTYLSFVAEMMSYYYNEINLITI